MNKTKAILSISLAIVTGAFLFERFLPGQNADPWTKEQLMETEQLANRINSGKDLPLILAVNPDGMYNLPYEGGITGSQWFGPAEEKKNLNSLKEYLKEVNREKDIVLYCGCCPFNMCPNIRPAFKLLTDMGFKNHKLLNLSKNIKEDWMDKGYPMKKESE